MKSLTRKVHLDYLRCFIILLVVAFHTSLSFMSKAPAWWYVKSDTTSILFTIFVIITDVFMMPVLFLISGYVLSIQLKKYQWSCPIDKQDQKAWHPLYYLRSFIFTTSLFINGKITWQQSLLPRNYYSLFLDRLLFSGTILVFRIAADIFSCDHFSKSI